MQENARRRMMGIHSLYRGQSNSNWEISCSLKRYQGRSTIDQLWAQYILAFNEYMNCTIALDWDKNMPLSENKNFYYLSIARHLDFPCNLIDWTSNLYLGLLIACDEFPEKDGCLFVMSGDLHINSKPTAVDPLATNQSILICKDFDLINPDCGLDSMPIARKRRWRQNGFFSIIARSDFDKKFEQLLPSDIYLKKYIIPYQLKPQITQWLSSKGITSELFLLDDNQSDSSINNLRLLKSKYFDKLSNS